MLPWAETWRALNVDIGYLALLLVVQINVSHFCKNWEVERWLLNTELRILKLINGTVLIVTLWSDCCPWVWYKWFVQSS